MISITYLLLTLNIPLVTYDRENPYITTLLTSETLLLVTRIYRIFTYILYTLS